MVPSQLRCWGIGHGVRVRIRTREWKLRKALVSHILSSPFLSPLPHAHPASASPDRNPRIPESSKSGMLRQVNPKDVRQLLHEVRDHPDANLSLRLTHLWSRSEESGTCGTIFVASRSDPQMFLSICLSSTSDSSSPLHGAKSRVLWSTLGGDTRSFIQVDLAPLKPWIRERTIKIGIRE